MVISGVLAFCLISCRHRFDVEDITKDAREGDSDAIDRSTTLTTSLGTGKARTARSVLSHHMVEHWLLGGLT